MSVNEEVSFDAKGNTNSFRTSDPADFVTLQIIYFTIQNWLLYFAIAR